MDVIKEWMNVVDGLVLVLLVLGIFGGVRRGLSGELLRIITIVIALVAGWYGADMAADWLADRSDLPREDLQIIGLIGVILSVYTLLGIVRHVFRLFLDFSFRGKLEIFGGAVLGLVRATVFCIIVLLGASMIPSEPVQEAVAKSNTGRFVVDQLTPVYNDWAEKNPDLKLPVKETPITTEPINLPATEEVLGPLIDTSDEFIDEFTE